MANEPTLSPAAQALYTNQRDALSRNIAIAAANLNPESMNAFNSISAKYPNMSKDLVMAMVQQGLNADTPGLGKITSIDGVTQLKNDARNVDKIKATVKSNRGLVGNIMDGFKNVVYDPFKGATRVGFAALRAPYDFATTITRDITQGGPILQDLATLGGKNTQLGSLIANANNGTGSGFFITEESKVGKDQAKAMGAYGKINGESFTIGRYAAKSLGATPETTAYKIMSGLVDASLNIALDPSTYLGAGSARQLLRGGKKLAESKAAVAGADALKTNAQITKDAIALAEEQAKLNVPGMKQRTADKFLKAESKYQEAQQHVVKGYTNTVSKLLNTEKDTFGNFAANPTAKSVLSPNNVAEWIIRHPKTTSGELVQAVDKLSADARNTGGFFDGYIMLDELPSQGKISIGAHGFDEYVVTAVTDKTPKLLDLADNFANATQKQIDQEITRRATLAKQIDEVASDMTQSPATRQTFDDLFQAIQDSERNLDGLTSSIGLTDTPATIASVIARAAQSKNAEAMSKLSDMIQKIWKVDGFSNTRAIYGETGGFVITNTRKFLAANKAEIGNAVAEIADPTNLGPNMIKLVDSMTGPESALAKTEAKMKAAAKAQADFERRSNDIALFRELADSDPEILTQIINDPNYRGLGKLMKMKVGAEGTLHEYIRNAVGLTENYAGELGSDFSKPLQYMLGPRFQEIAEVVAKETDSYRVHNFFGKKLDAEMVQALTDSKTADDVFRVFLTHLGHETSDPNIFRSMALRAEAGKLVANPLARLVDPVSLVPIRFAETMERSFNRYFVRSTALNLGDLTGLTNGVENWITSAGIKSVIGKDAQEKIVADTARKLFASTSNQQRAGIVENVMADIVEKIGQRAGLDEEMVKQLKNVVKISGEEKSVKSAYSVNHITENTTPEVVFGDKVIKLPSAMHEFQLLQDYIHLPDTKEVLKTVNKFQANMLYGKALAGKVLLEEMGDVWRTAQLVFRISYVWRNIAEMQMRQMFTGHASMISHPLQFAAMVMANPATRRGKFATKVARYNTDLAGNVWKNAEAEGDYLEAIREYQVYAHRMNSVSDYRSNGRSEVFKYYRVVEAGHEDYAKGLAFTLNRFASDRLNPDIARYIINGAPESAKRQYVADLIADFDKKDSVIKDYVIGAFSKNEGIKEIFLKDVGNVDLPIKDNLDPEKIFTFFFDETQPHTLAGQINAVAGNGPKSHLIKNIIANGSASFTDEAGNAVKISAPWFDSPKSARELDALEKSFKDSLEKHFTAEDLKGSRVLSEKETAIGGLKGKEITRMVDGFFEWATRLESKYNFGPEYTMAYWDHVGRYTRMLSTDDLKYVQKKAQQNLAPIGKVVNGKYVTIGRKHPTLRIIETELKKRLNNPEYTHIGGAGWQTIHQMAAREASKFTKDLFYDAAKQRQWSNAMRLIFPFAQAQTNTMSKWADLFWKNPVPAYRFAKSYQALTKPGSNVIYDVSGMTYDDNQGFFYKDPGSQEEKFKMPIVGSVLGALAGRNLSTSQALQLTAPVQSLNLAFGQVNPIVPGVGPVGQFLFTASGKTAAFGPTYEMFRDIVTPFGEPKSISDVVFPSWLKKSFLYRLGDQTTVQRGVKDWASYLASTGSYGDNPLASDEQRTKLFHDAESLSRETGFLTALFQSISPATPSNEILAKIKNPDNKMNFMTMTMLYKTWDDISQKNPGDYGKAITQFADIYGSNNLLVALGGTTSAVRGTDDAWTFLNNNPDAADKYARNPGDVVPYFFPGGEYSIKYYNWQKRTGARTALNVNQLANEAEGMIYSMLKSQLADKQIAAGYTQYWYNQELAKLDAQFGGRPPESVITNTAGEKIARVGQALSDRAFQQSPVYKETAEFYGKYQEFQKLLNTAKASNYAELKSKGGYATLMRNDLVATAEKLMAQNPSFTRMYYGVFAGQLEG